MSTELAEKLNDCANRLRVTSIEITAAANGGNSIFTVFFHEMRYDPKNPKDINADRFVLSKGHACPVLYAAWLEAGVLTHEQCMELRKVDSDLEGHPTPRLNFIDVATGSLGQGLSAACGMAYNGKYYDKASYRTYCLLGDGECFEGSNWEAAAFASHYKLDNLLAIVDVNRLGQTKETHLGHETDVYLRRFEAFGWHAISVDGHSVEELLHAYDQARLNRDKPTVIIAKTKKGCGIEDVVDKDGFHGKAVDKEKAEAIRAKLTSANSIQWKIPQPVSDVPSIDLKRGTNKLSSPPEYKMNEEVATRKAYGTALTKLAEQNPRIIALDGDVSNSTFSELVAKKFPDQFIECFIGEQNMVGVGVGLSCRARTIPFVSSFAAFLERGADQIRMAAISFANVKFCGSHAGISIGDDGPSQMALEDLALFRAIPDSVVLYPSDAVSAEHAVELVANTVGIAYIRTGRPAVPVIYSNDEKFEIGKAKVLKQSDNDKFVIVACGVTLFEALKAHSELAKENIHVTVVDLFSVKPLDAATLLAEAKRVGGRIITVEDHYQAGGIGEAVASELSEHPFVSIRRLFVKELPRSGAPEQLLDRYGISARSIVNAVKSFN
ncbi:Transket-pyr domain-containing protein [Aphelenchoides bicaudatus]|nr:Transket-pyr domain-containing protein [Aphelenchoides bicaudatus]